MSSNYTTTSPHCGSPRHDTFVEIEIPKDDDHHSTKSNKKKSSSLQKSPFLLELWQSWESRNDFCKAQVQIAAILALAYCGNNWPNSYPRDDNENAAMFWLMNAVIVVAALTTLKHNPDASSRGIQVLSRDQTEEWKGLMQWVFIMYHYYRARFAYNEIRVFVSCYVFLTGWGNWQYFSKQQDFSFERAASMWIRINYFPLLLCLVVGTKLDDFYIVPLHTTGFFVTMATAYLAQRLESVIKSTPCRNLTAITISLLAHIAFYETSTVNVLKLFSEEIFFRFQADKYSTWVGILAGFSWTYVKQAAQFYNSLTDSPTDHQRMVTIAQIAAGLTMIAFWYGLFGHITDKYTYNPMHPYIFWIPLVGWLLVRNASKYLMELHSQVLEFFGRITLETYVLQFHLFMCQHVKHILVLVPGGGADGHIVLQTLNMLVTGCIFVATAYYARQGTVVTQTASMELMQLLRKSFVSGIWRQSNKTLDDGANENLVETLLVPFKKLNHDDDQQQQQQHHRKGIQSAAV